jgi:hypothetical protein
MTELGFDVSPQRLARQLMNDLDDDSMALALPPRPAAAFAEDSVVSGVSFQSSTSRMSSGSDDKYEDAPPTRTLSSAGGRRKEATPMEEDDFRTAQIEAPTPRPKSTATLSSSSTGANTLMPIRHGAVGESSSTIGARGRGDSTARVARSEPDSSSIGLPPQPADDSAEVSTYSSSVKSSNGIGSPGVARGRQHEQPQTTLASVLARNMTESTSSSTSMTPSQRSVENPQAKEHNEMTESTSTADMSFSSELPPPPVARAPISSTPKANKTASPSVGNWTGKASAGTLSARKVGSDPRAVPQKATQSSSRLASATPSSRHSGDGVQIYVSATDNGVEAPQNQTSRSVADLSISTIASDAASEPSDVEGDNEPADATAESVPKRRGGRRVSAEPHRGECHIGLIGTRFDLTQMNFLQLQVVAAQAALPRSREARNRGSSPTCSR